MKKSPKRLFFLLETCMLKALLGKKLNMDLVYDSHGRATPVTEIKVEPNVITLIREKDKDGYRAVQVGIGKRKKANKPEQGWSENAKLKATPSFLKEVNFEGEIALGQEIKIEDVFHKGGMVDVIGTSKGKGFAGVVKRYNFSGGPKTHGQSDRHRAPGSIGSGTTPGRVMKGLKMAGHMGNAQVSILGLEIMGLDKEKESLLVKGSIPGAVGGLVLISKSNKKKEVYHEPEIPAVPNLGGAGEEETKADGGEVNAEETKEEISVPENQA